MKDVLEAFDRYLVKRRLHFSATVIGGAALIVMGLIERATKDVDCLHPSIPPEVKKASEDFAQSVEGQAFKLKKDWFNNGPASLLRDLPKDWTARLISLFAGTHLKLMTLGRIDLLRSKLFAYCDRQQDLQDCLALKPTQTELNTIYPWLAERDANPDWPEHVRISLVTLGGMLGYEFKP